MEVVRACQPESGLSADPGHIGGTMFPNWPGNASGCPQKSVLGLSAKDTAPTTQTQVS